MPDPAAKSVLKNTYPSLTSDNKLKIVSHDSVNAQRLESESGQKAVKEAIAKFTGKEVDFVVEAIPSDGSKDSSNPNILALKNIHMDITTENREETDYV